MPQQSTGTDWRSLVTPRTAVMAATGGVSLVLGELFFKFGSFTLEVIAFLATWGILFQIGRLGLAAMKS